MIPDNLLPILEEMRYELKANRLEVCIVPGTDDARTEEGRFIRVAQCANASWYRALCELYPCTRRKRRRGKKDYTKIKRKYITKVLRNMIKNKSSKSKYAEDILAMAKDRLDQYERSWIPWNNQF